VFPKLYKNWVEYILINWI